LSWGIFESWEMRDSYVGWLRRLHKASETAEKLGLTECNRCGFCCARRPCIPTPDELKIIADYLGMDVKDMIAKYFVADRLGGKSTEFIFPAKKSQLDITGTFIEWDRTYDTGYCVFYDEEKRECKIYEVRPQNARDTNCWESKDSTDKTLEKWEDVDLEDFGIREVEDW